MRADKAAMAADGGIVVSAFSFFDCGLGGLAHWHLP